MMRLELKLIAAVVLLAFVTMKALADPELEQLIARANQGDVEAQVELGRIYVWRTDLKSDGSGRLKANLDEAFRWLTAAAKQGSLRGKAMLAGLYSSSDFDRRNDSIAARLFVEVARSGDPDIELVRAAQYALGRLLYQECTGPLISLDCGPNETSPYRDYSAAARWFELAAKSGHRDAQFQLATMYENGRGVPQDFTEAANLYRAAAEAGDERAPIMLGELYVRMEDLVSAHMWFNLGATNDRNQYLQEKAAESRDKIARRMNSTQIAKAQELARNYWKSHNIDRRRQ
jgi:TPR repeat protein